MNLPPVKLADWRAQVDKELAGRSFERTLVHQTDEGLSIAPLYTEAPPSDVPRDSADRPFKICVRHDPGTSADDLAADLGGGADALWLRLDEALLAGGPLPSTFCVLDVDHGMPSRVVERLSRVPSNASAGLALAHDPLGLRTRGDSKSQAASDDLAAVGRWARLVEDRLPDATAVMVSTLPYHEMGADGADELAIALSTGARYLEVLLDAGLSPDRAARQIAVQTSVGRDMFLELCKVRALRVCWQKLLAAFGATGAPRTLIHAVCSSRTLTVRDPWVNILRVTTQVFSAVLGGADLVTPNEFDRMLGPPSALGRRVARNTGLVLREESFLGRVADPAGGSYYLETLTDAFAREAWARFRAIEKEGGIAPALESGRIRARLEAAWHGRLQRIATGKVALLGVSEFANLDEKLPRPAPALNARDERPWPHRDAETFEALRTRAGASHPPPEALLVTLGSLSESRPRATFAAGFFAAGGIRTRESTKDETAPIACLCGTDDRYASDAAPRARALKAAGCGRVLLAGRPGALEASLREAGVDGFIFVGCDVVATLSDLLGEPS
jgi:methylmalonyl-CoA mutase